MIAHLKLVAKNMYIAVGLLLNTNKKTAMNIGESLNVSHDKIQRLYSDSPAVLREKLKDISTKIFDVNQKITFVVDDTVTSKKHAHAIEGIDMCWDGSNHMAAIGHQFLNGMITDGKTKIPVSSRLCTSKKIDPSSLGKVAYAFEMIMEYKKIFPKLIACMDAHFSTKVMIPQLVENTIDFLMKFNRTKKIIVNKQEAQIQQLLKLKKNTHFLCVEGTFNETKAYFYAIKFDDGGINYYVSNMHFHKKKQLLAIYKQRWGIETFHRTAKQLLGWNECQMRSAEKQTYHRLAIMCAYTMAELYKMRKNLPNTETAIRTLRKLKLTQKDLRIIALGENYHVVA